VESAVRVENLLTGCADSAAEEVFCELLANRSFKLERIVSTGQATPPGKWLDQDRDEWVAVLRGSARLRFEGPHQEIDLRAGDYLTIPAHRRHRVEWTDDSQPTIWLALHFDANVAD